MKGRITPIRDFLAGRSVAAALALILVGGIAPAFVSNALAEDAKTLKDLKSRDIQLHKDSKVEASSSKAMDNYRRFLELQKTDPQLRAEALRRLGDLNLDAGELDAMAKQVNLVDLQSSEAIKLYSTLLKAYPDYARNDQVLYQLARAYETTGQPEQALATLNKVVQKYPNSPQMDEVQFRRGELLFSAKKYQESGTAYAVVVRIGKSSEYYEQSLYKEGWSLFKQSMTDESLPSFAGVLDLTLVRNGKAVSIDTLRRADRELVEDTLRVMSIAFSYGDGAASVDAFLKKHGDAPYEYLLYSRLGDFYVDKQRYQDGAVTYLAYVKRDPYSDHAPELAMQAIGAYDKGGFSDLVLAGKHEFVERYNFDSPFWKTREHGQYAKVVQELKVNLKDVATYYHATAQKSKKIEDYQEAARWYRQYLKSFPDDPDSAANNYLLAETLFESHQYADAAAEYEHTAYAYPKNAKSATAAYAGLVSYQKGEESLVGADKVAWHKKATDAGVKFATAFPEHPDSAGVLTRAATDIYAAKDLPRAITVSEQLLARQPPVDEAKQRIGWSVIARSHYELNEFDKAEPAFEKALQYAGTDEKERNDLTESLAASVYKQGEAKQKTGDTAGAVDDFLRVAKVAPTSTIRSTATYDAGTQLIVLKQWDRAIRVLEDYRHQFPKDHPAEVTQKLAVAYSESGHPGEAAGEFEKIAADPTQDRAVQREALLQSADLYAKANNVPKAVGMLEKFVASNPTPVVDAEEARQRLADYATKSGDLAKRDYWYREIIKVDSTAGAQRTDRTHFLAAKAQLALAAPARDEFRAIRLTAPLKKSLVAKRKALEAAMDGYKKAAAYNVAEVTTASTFEIAELYRSLSKDVMNSERPKGLKGDELEEYNSLLEEQVIPFEDESIKAHELNTARTKDGVYDEWVKKSFEVLAELKPARYSKTELTQDVVTSLN
jgi:cellulose synthase operon protein C